MTFDKLDLHPHLIKAINNAGFKSPTPVQEQSIPHILAGGDLMACAQTGTGKTAAFTLPVVHHLLSNAPKKRSNAPRVLILTPTRELADQILANINIFTRGSQLKTGLIVGGVSYGPQIQMMRRPLDILVATPGRLIDHMGEGRIDLSQIEVMILDEADRMLDMGFVKPVERIVSDMPKERQTLLFSATFSPEVERLAKRFLKNPVQVRLAAATQNHDQITQSMYYTSGKDQKADLLKEVLADGKVWQAIVFMRTKHSTDRLAKTIASWGHEAAALHGDMRQSARKRVIEQMHKGKVKVLVATDVAARGLDVKELSHVVNFDLPQVAEDYVHRIGRTGRAGAEGTALSFVSRDEFHLLRAIETMMGRKITAENERPHSHAPQRANSGRPQQRNGQRKSFGGGGAGAGGGRPQRSNGPRTSEDGASRGARAPYSSDRPQRGNEQKPSYSAGRPQRGTLKAAEGTRSDRPQRSDKAPYSANRPQRSDDTRANTNNAHRPQRGTLRTASAEGRPQRSGKPSGNGGNFKKSYGGNGSSSSRKPSGNRARPANRAV